jgi:hypothetical protein
MNYERLLIGIGLLIIAYALHYWIKDDKPSSKENSWTGPTLSNFIGLWGWTIMALIAGLAYILSSFLLRI